MVYEVQVIKLRLLVLVYVYYMKMTISMYSRLLLEEDVEV